MTRSSLEKAPTPHPDTESHQGPRKVETTPHSPELEAVHTDHELFANKADSLFTELQHYYKGKKWEGKENNPQYQEWKKAVEGVVTAEKLQLILDQNTQLEKQRADGERESEGFESAASSTELTGLKGTYVPEAIARDIRLKTAKEGEEKDTLRSHGEFTVVRIEAEINVNNALVDRLKNELARLGKELGLSAQSGKTPSAETLPVPEPTRIDTHTKEKVASPLLEAMQNELTALTAARNTLQSNLLQKNWEDIASKDAQLLSTYNELVGTFTELKNYEEQFQNASNRIDKLHELLQKMIAPKEHTMPVQQLIDMWDDGTSPIFKDANTEELQRVANFLTTIIDEYDTLTVKTEVLNNTVNRLRTEVETQQSQIALMESAAEVKSPTSFRIPDAIWNTQLLVPKSLHKTEKAPPEIPTDTIATASSSPQESPLQPASKPLTVERRPTATPFVTPSKKPSGRLKKWLARILSAAAIGGIAGDAGVHIEQGMQETGIASSRTAGNKARPQTRRLEVPTTPDAISLKKDVPPPAHEASNLSPHASSNAPDVVAPPPHKVTTPQKLSTRKNTQPTQLDVAVAAREATAPIFKAMGEPQPITPSERLAIQHTVEKAVGPALKILDSKKTSSKKPPLTPARPGDRPEARVDISHVGMPGTFLRRARDAERKWQSASDGREVEKYLKEMYVAAKTTYQHAKELNDAEAERAARKILEQAIENGTGSYLDAGLIK